MNDGNLRAAIAIIRHAEPEAALRLGAMFELDSLLANPVSWSGVEWRSATAILSVALVPVNNKVRLQVSSPLPGVESLLRSGEWKLVTDDGNSITGLPGALGIVFFQLPPGKYKICHGYGRHDVVH